MVELIIQARGAGDELIAVIRHAAAAALSHEGRQGDINIALVDDSEIQRMNREYREVDQPTDVLSFPAWEGYEIYTAPDGFLGDIAISLPKAQEQANTYDHSLARELAFLTVHGTLHLLGYDHVKAEDETEMSALQETILNEMGLNR